MSCSLCDSPVYGLGLCNKHYKRYRRHGDPTIEVMPRGTLESRFWTKVEKGKNCWEWTGGKSKTGYGVIQEGGRGSRAMSAHRVSYELHHGPIPVGMYVLHSCDNRGCVNPAHLRAGMQDENIQEAYDKGRKRSPFVHAHNRARG